MDLMQIAACKMMGSHLSTPNGLQPSYIGSASSALLTELAETQRIKCGSWQPITFESRLSLKDFLCFMFYLKYYPTDAIGCNFMKRSESTYQERMARCLEALENVNTIDFDDRWVNWNAKISSIYQVAAALGTSKIILVSLGVPCGESLDLTMVHNYLFPILPEDKRAAGDKDAKGVAVKLRTPHPSNFK
ncbi:hypothetical protein BC829DRAFT_420239 [Chytridium lagenaria]|nr:hypothetical protein BC829DRAFT_420239 [Chytridium lagenaria]